MNCQKLDFLTLIVAEEQEEEEAKLGVCSCVNFPGLAGVASSSLWESLLKREMNVPERMKEKQQYKSLFFFGPSVTNWFVDGL